MVSLLKQRGVCSAEGTTPVAIVVDLECDCVLTLFTHSFARIYMHAVVFMWIVVLFRVCIQMCGGSDPRRHEVTSPVRSSKNNCTAQRLQLQLVNVQGIQLGTPQQQQQLPYEYICGCCCSVELYHTQPNAASNKMSTVVAQDLIDPVEPYFVIFR